MPEKNEQVVVELGRECRLRLYGQITARMEKLGYNPCDYGSLKLGIYLPPAWPVDEKYQPTLAELVVVICKLKMRLIIGDVNLEPLKQDDG